jgi:DNA processing protein
MAKDLFSSHPPFTPPTTEEDRLAWLRLIRSYRVGPATFLRLLSEHGCAHAALDALPGIARSSGVAQYSVCNADVARREIDAARAVGAKMLCYGSPHYPATLAEIADSPPVLWCMGRKAPIIRPMVALVGARNASSLGTRMARKLAEGLGYHGYTVVSGLARGIDTAAHFGALKTGTVAAMAGGVDVIYPTENAVLAASIADQGLRLSEQPMGMAPQARHFPRRNRIISGLALAVVVVEAAEKSGTLLTVRDALDQGREVMAVPGHPVDARAAGCNRLIRDGAALVRGVEDVLEVLSRLTPTATMLCEPVTEPMPEPRQQVPSAALHSQILAYLGPTPLAEDQLIRDLALPSAKVTPELVMMELDGAILRHPGGLISRA